MLLFHFVFGSLNSWVDFLSRLNARKEGTNSLVTMSPGLVPYGRYSADGNKVGSSRCKEEGWHHLLSESTDPLITQMLGRLLRKTKD